MDPCIFCNDEHGSRQILYACQEYSPSWRLVCNDWDTGIRHDCEDCGSYILTSRDYDKLKDQEGRLDQATRTRLRCLICEHSLARLPVIWLRLQPDKHYGRLQVRDPFPEEIKRYAAVHIDELLRRWPSRVSDRLARTLTNLSRIAEFGLPVDVNCLNLTFSTMRQDHMYVLDSLEGLGYIDRRGSNLDTLRATITPLGWDYVEKLQHQPGSPFNPAFVAMWFGDDQTKDEMDHLYLQAIRPAIEAAGYKETRVDITPHNDYIMNKIIGDIRAAPFVVADMTGHRNGVYFEAGFARGLGSPVIHTCKNSDFEHAHFDIEQLPHLLWDSPEDLKEKLKHWIRGSIGTGPYMERDETGDQA